MDPGSLRAACREHQTGLWHWAVADGRTDVREYLKSKGLLDLIDQRNGYGATPLCYVLVFAQEEAARWMVDNGADINTVAGSNNESTFWYACAKMSPSFVEELAGKVVPE